MNERAVRWIHQADDSVVHGARQIGPEMRDFEVVTESGKARHFRQTRLLGGRCRAAFWIRHKSPDVSVALRTGEAACVDSLTFQFRICCKRRDHKALAGVRFKLPAMVGAFDGFTVKLPEGKGKRTVRAKGLPATSRPRTSGTFSSIARTSLRPVTCSLRSAGYQNPHKNSLPESAELRFELELILRSTVA